MALWTHPHFIVHAAMMADGRKLLQYQHNNNFFDSGDTMTWIACVTAMAGAMGISLAVQFAARQISANIRAATAPLQRTVQQE